MAKRSLDMMRAPGPASPKPRRVKVAPKVAPTPQLVPAPEFINEPIDPELTDLAEPLELIDDEGADGPIRTDEPSDAADPNAATMHWRRAPLWLRFLGGAFVLLALLAGSFELVYAHKILPGITV